MTSCSRKFKGAPGIAHSPKNTHKSSCEATGISYVLPYLGSIALPLGYCSHTLMKNPKAREGQVHDPSGWKSPSLFHKFPLKVTDSYLILLPFLSPWASSHLLASISLRVCSRVRARRHAHLWECVCMCVWTAHLLSSFHIPLGFRNSTG